MKLRTRICVQKWQLEHHNVSNYYFYYQKVVPFVAKIAFFCFLYTLHSKFCGRNLENTRITQPPKIPDLIVGRLFVRTLRSHSFA